MAMLPRHANSTFTNQIQNVTNDAKIRLTVPKSD